MMIRCEGCLDPTKNHSNACKYQHQEDPRMFRPGDLEENKNDDCDDDSPQTQNRNKRARSKVIREPNEVSPQQNRKKSNVKGV